MVNLLKATVNGLQSLRRPEEVARARGKAVEDVLFPAKKKAEEQATEAEPEAQAEPEGATETDDSGEAEDHADA